MNHQTQRPVIPEDVREYIDCNGYKLQCAKGVYWYVCGENSGDPFELGIDLFISLYRANNK